MHGKESMDFGMHFSEPPQRGKYEAIRGRIREISPFGRGADTMDSCMLMIGVQTQEQGRVNFVLTPETYVVDFETLETGMEGIFWHRLDVPVPLIYPPQHQAVVAARDRNDRSIDVAHYDEALLNDTNTLQLNLDRSVKVRTVNNQVYQGNPGGKDLVVVYNRSTRSIPAQTTPSEIVVLCE